MKSSQPWWEAKSCSTVLDKDNVSTPRDTDRGGAEWAKLGEVKEECSLDVLKGSVADNNEYKKHGLWSDGLGEQRQTHH